MVSSIGQMPFSRQVSQKFEFHIGRIVYNTRSVLDILSNAIQSADGEKTLLRSHVSVCPV